MGGFFKSHLPKQLPQLAEDLRRLGGRYEGSPVGEPSHLSMTELAMISADQVPGLPRAGRKQQGAGISGFRLLEIAECVAGQAQPEGDIGMVRVDAARFVQQLPGPGVVAGAMAQGA